MEIINGKWICPTCNTENSCADKSKSCPACGYQLTSSEIKQIEANAKSIVPKTKPDPKIVKPVSETYTPKRMSNNDFKESIYIQACNIFNSAKTGTDYIKAEKQFNRIKDYKDSYEKIQESIYIRACSIFNSANNTVNNLAKKEADYIVSEKLFSRIKDYKDSYEKIIHCQNGYKEAVYNRAEALYNSKRYRDANACYQKIIDYRDSSEKIKAIQDIENKEKDNSKIYNDAKAYMDGKHYKKAYKKFLQIQGFKDSSSLLKECKIELRQQTQRSAVNISKAVFIIILFVMQTASFVLFSMYMDHKQFIVDFVNSKLGNGFYPNHEILYTMLGILVLLVLSVILDTVITLITKEDGLIITVLPILSVIIEIIITSINFYGLLMAVLVSIVPVMLAFFLWCFIVQFL